MKPNLKAGLGKESRRATSIWPVFGHRHSNQRLCFQRKPSNHLWIYQFPRSRSAHPLKLQFAMSAMVLKNQTKCIQFVSASVWWYLKQLIAMGGLGNHSLLRRYRDAKGAKKVHGGAGLKMTQAYTPEFGRGLAAWWMAHGPTTAGTERFMVQCNDFWCVHASLNPHADSDLMSCKFLKPYHAWRRKRRQWCLAQSADLSLDMMKDGVGASKFHHDSCKLKLFKLCVSWNKQVENICIYIWQDQIADYSKLEHRDFTEGYLINALDELRGPWRKRFSPVHDEIVIDWHIDYSTIACFSWERGNVRSGIAWRSCWETCLIAI